MAKKISFCTTCKGRTHHLKRTLLKNIRDNVGTGTDVEFVVVDYDSKDGMQDWILNDPDLAPHLDNGTLKYARYPEGEHFHIAHAKNMAHRLATGDVVCNVDADNFTGPGFAKHLEKTFDRNPESLVSPALSMSKHIPGEERGFYGRIAMSKKNFMALGGYDEGFKGWGGEDDDLILRGLGMGLSAVPFSSKEFIQVIPHSHEERVANMKGDKDAMLKKISATMDGHVPATPNGSVSKAFWGVSKAKQMAAMVQSLRAIQRNDGHFGEGTVELGRDRRIEKIQQSGAPPVQGQIVQGSLKYLVLKHIPVS